MAKDDKKNDLAYSEKEVQALAEMQKDDAMNMDMVAQFLVDHAGDMKLNAKLKADLRFNEAIADAHEAADLEKSAQEFINEMQEEINELTTQLNSERERGANEDEIKLIEEKLAEQQEELELNTERFQQVKEQKATYLEIAQKALTKAGRSEDPLSVPVMSDAEKGNKEMLSYYTFKTRGRAQGKNALDKLDLAQAQKEAGLELEEFEKPTLRELGEVEALSSVYSKGEDWREDEVDILDIVANNTNIKEFKELYQNCARATEFKAQMTKEASKQTQLETGDIMMYRTSKTTALKGRQHKMEHEGKLEERFITKYNHAAPIYIDRSDPEGKKIITSDVWSQQRNSDIALHEMLEADSFRIDPTKLVSKAHAKELSKIDYGNKTDKDGNELKDKDGQPIKNTWQEVMQERYRDLSLAMHSEQEAYKERSDIQGIRKASKELEEVRDKKDQLLENYGELVEELEAIEERLTTLKEDLKGLHEEETALNNDIKFDGRKKRHMKHKAAIARRRKSLKKQQEKATKRKAAIGEEKGALVEKHNALELKEAALSTQLDQKIEKFQETERDEITNDGERLTNPLNWVLPAITSLGHKLFKKNNVKELSEKMFNAQQTKRAMICSEFSARSISACMHQLNKMTAIDMQAQGLAKQGATIVANPIPARENFNKLHPERLVNLLQKSGCIEQLHNKALTAVIQTENVARTKSANFMENLPKKLLSVMKASKDIDDFKDKAAKVTSAYLKQSKISQEVVNEVLPQVKSSLDDLYKQKHHQPRTIKEKIGKICIKVLEFCKLRTKDKSIKEAISKATTAIASQANTKQVSHVERLAQQRAALAPPVPPRRR